MGQEEIIELLEKQKGPLSISEIMEVLGEERRPAVKHSIQSLVKFGEIKFVELDRNKAREVLGVKTLCRRARFYYVGNFRVFPKVKGCSGKG